MGRPSNGTFSPCELRLLLPWGADSEVSYFLPKFNSKSIFSAFRHILAQHMKKYIVEKTRQPARITPQNVHILVILPRSEWYLIYIYIFIYRECFEYFSVFIFIREVHFLYIYY